MREEISTQPLIPVAPKELIFLPPLNPPKPYKPPLPRDGSQPRTAARNQHSGPSLPFVPAHKWLTVKLPNTLRMLIWSPNGTELVCTFYHDLPQLINIKHPVETLHSFAQGHSACWSPDGVFLPLACTTRTILKPKSVFVIEEPQRNATGCCCSINQSLFVDWTGHRGDSSQSGWITNSWFMISQKSRPKSIFLTHHTRSLLGDNMYCDQLTTLRWSPNGEWLAAGSNNGQIVCWQPHTARYLKQQPLKKNIRSISWSPDGRILVVAFANKQVLFWNCKPDKSHRQNCQKPQGW
jgi:FOG: WD40 repeat